MNLDTLAHLPNLKESIRGGEEVAVLFLIIKMSQVQCLMGTEQLQPHPFPLFSHALHPPLQYSLRRISNKMILQELGGVKFTGSVVWDSGKAPSLQPPSAHCTKQQLQLALWVRCCKIKQDRIETLTPFAVD